MTRIDLRQEHKALYNPPRGRFVVVEVPALHFLMVDGAGDPNESPAYQEAVEALYAVAYAVRFALKREGVDAPVGLLEGLWWADDPVAFLQNQRGEWLWAMMIAQPEVVNAERVAWAVAEARRKKSLPGLDRVRFESYHEGTAVQTMYQGPYAEETSTIAALHAFIESEGYAPAGKHHEVYLNDPRRTAPERLRTILRQPVRTRG